LAIKANILIDQGADFETSINVTDDNGDIIDLTGYTGSAQMRKYYTSSTSYPFIVTISAAEGKVTLSMPASNSAVISSGRFVYDCEIVYTSSNVVSRLVEGIATITPQVTR